MDSLDRSREAQRRRRPIRVRYETHLGSAEGTVDGEILVSGRKAEVFPERFAQRPLRGPPCQRQIWHHGQMFEPGSRSKQVSTFMLPDDEAAFDEVLAPTIVGLGQWQTHDQHARTITLRNSLPEAMSHDGIQAFLRLLGRDGGTVGPLIQYLHTSVFTTDETALAATGGRYRATGPRPESMSPGRLAFAWSPAEQADCIQRDFPLLTDLAWKALQAVTSPHIESVDSKLMRRYRIGLAAKAWLLDRPQTAIYDGGLRLQVRSGRTRPAVSGS